MCASRVGIWKEASTFTKDLELEVIEPVSELNEDAIARAFQTPGGHVKVLHMAPPGAPSKMFIDLVQWLEPASTGALILQRTTSVSITSRFVCAISKATTANSPRARHHFSQRQTGIDRTSAYDPHYRSRWSVRPIPGMAVESAGECFGRLPAQLS